MNLHPHPPTCSYSFIPFFSSSLFLPPVIPRLLLLLLPVLVSCKYPVCTHWLSGQFKWQYLRNVSGRPTLTAISGTAPPPPGPLPPPAPRTQTQTHSQHSSDGSPPDKHALVDLIVLPGCSRKRPACTPTPWCTPNPHCPSASEEVRKGRGGF